MNNLQGEFILKKKGEEPGKTQGLLPEVKKDAQYKVVKESSQAKKALIPKSNPTPFSSFCYYPDNVIFQNQEADEEIILLLRRHFITNSSWIFALVAALLLPLIFIPLYPSITLLIPISQKVQLLTILFYYLILLGIFLVNFSLWYFDVMFVTNKRIIDVDVSGILFRNVAETNIDLLQDVSYTQVGVTRSFFNYGDVLIQTMTPEQHFELKAAPRPSSVIQIIGELIVKEHP